MGQCGERGPLRRGRRRPVHGRGERHGARRGRPQAGGGRRRPRPDRSAGRLTRALVFGGKARHSRPLAAAPGSAACDKGREVMPRFSAKLLCAVASSALLWSAPASAQSVDRIVAFGDSYADDGNLFELIGIDPPFVYPTGRFSGGTNFVDPISTLLNAPAENFAIGGADRKSPRLNSSH